MPCRGAWPHLQELYEEFGNQGLVVVGVSPEDAKLVSDYVDSMGITLPIASGCQAGGPYGVSGIPSSALIGPDGKIAWTGHPNSLSKGKVKEVLKGAKKRSTNFLAVPVETEPKGRLAAVAKSMAQGELGKALSAAQEVALDEKAAGTEKEEASALVGAIEAHVKLLSEQAEGFVKSKDVLKALLVFDALGKEPGGERGDAAKKRAAEIRKDPSLVKEIAGAEALARAQEQAAKLASGKAKAKYQEVVDKHKGTRAAERAQAILRAKK